MQYLDNKSIDELKMGIDILTAEKIMIDYQNVWMNRNEAIELLNKRLHNDPFIVLIFLTKGLLRLPLEQQNDHMLINDLWWLQRLLFCEFAGREIEP